jgi:DNA-binding NarL/FixJ family response regulator
MSEPSAVLRTVVASDNFLTREGLGCLLSGARGIEIVARVDSHPETLTAIRQYRPDVLIVGIRTPRVNAEAALSAARAGLLLTPVRRPPRSADRRCSSRPG